MATKNISVKKLHLRNDVRANFTATKVYGKGEPLVVWETDGGYRVYIGDGVTAFSELKPVNLTLADLPLSSATVDGLLSKADFAKLASIAAGAQVNVIEAVAVNGTALEITDKGVNIVVPTGALAGKDKVAETDLSDELKAKVNAAAEGNHSHDNKTVLDGITAEKVGNWDGAVNKADTLVGTDSGKSARAIAAEELAKQLIPENASEAMDTLAEVAAWIQAHPGDAAAMNQAIDALETLVGTLPKGAAATTVVGYIKEYADSVVAALNIGDYATAANLSAAIARIAALENVGATKVEASTKNGNIKINGTETPVYQLPATVVDTGDELVIDCGGAND